MLQYCFYFIFWFFGQEACEILHPLSNGTLTLCIGRWSLNLWTTREVPCNIYIYIYIYTYLYILIELFLISLLIFNPGKIYQSTDELGECRFDAMNSWTSYCTQNWVQTLVLPISGWVIGITGQVLGVSEPQFRLRVRTDLGVLLHKREGT